MKNGFLPVLQTESRWLSEWIAFNVVLLLPEPSIPIMEMRLGPTSQTDLYHYRSSRHPVGLELATPRTTAPPVTRTLAMPYVASIQMQNIQRVAEYGMRNQHETQERTNVRKYLLNAECGRRT